MLLEIRNNALGQVHSQILSQVIRRRWSLCVQRPCMFLFYLILRYEVYPTSNLCMAKISEKLTSKSSTFELWSFVNTEFSHLKSLKEVKYHLQFKFKKKNRIANVSLASWKLLWVLTSFSFKKNQCFHSQAEVSAESGYCNKIAALALQCSFHVFWIFLFCKGVLFYINWEYLGCFIQCQN